MMQFSAVQIAQMIGGKIEGDENASVHNFAKIEEAKQGDLCFLANPKYTDYIYTTQASIAIVNEDLQLKQAVTPTLIRVKEAYASFAVLLQYYQNMLQQSKQKTGIEQPSFIAESAKIGTNVYIGAFAHIGNNVVIGDNTKIYPNTVIGDDSKIGNDTTIFAGVKIYHECVVGNKCVIHAGVVIGADGFGFAKSAGVYNKIPQIGNVVIEDEVEIGANTCLDRATMGSTIVRKGVKLDNLIQVAHNVEVGANTVVAGLSALGGSTKIGSEVMIGAQAGLAGHITIANHAMINAQSGVSKSITQEGSAVTGSPASDFKAMMRSQAVIKNLPTLQARVNELERKVERLKNSE
jgi:UDP-3-O-[3-hydroxymyristoyl] glucosamine N-acyltransferase